MSIEQIETELARELANFRKEVEVHLAQYPMGSQYFGMKSANNPRLVARLRAGCGVRPETISKVRMFMRDRADRAMRRAAQ